MPLKYVLAMPFEVLLARAMLSRQSGKIKQARMMRAEWQLIRRVLQESFFRNDYMKSGA